MKPVYTLDDLASREVLDAGADKPAKLAVLGWPIAHSASPRMHQSALDAQGIDARYIRLAVEPGRIAEAFARMRELGFIGCNVTVPHKLDALENCEPDHDAVLLGAVNTIRFDADATRGFNTDGPGFARAIEDDFGVWLGSLNVVVAGAGGGAGQAIATQCVLMGVPKLVLVNRTVEKLGPLVERLKAMKSTVEIVALPFDDPELKGQCLSCDLIVNTSSVGLKTSDPSILPADCLKPGHLVYDAIYSQKGAFTTQTLSLSAAQGCKNADGLSMLLHQGALAFQHWFPQADPATVLAAMRKGLA